MRRSKAGDAKIDDLKSAVAYSLNVIARRAISSYELKKNSS
jgi:hypothetical protein